MVRLAALLTMPGVPTLFAGVEVGCEGSSIDTTRVPFPWDHLATIHESESHGDGKSLNDLHTLIEMRRRSDALRHGSLHWVDATEHPALDDSGVDGCAVEFGEGNVVEVHLAAGSEPTTIVLPGTPGTYVVSCPRR